MENNPRWPAFILPAMVTIILSALLYLFIYTVDSAQRKSEQEKQHNREFAILEANELLLTASDALNKLYLERGEAINARDRRLQQEAKEILDATHRLISASLEKPRETSSPRQGISDFPHGFEGVRKFLEHTPWLDNNDRPFETLQANAPEIAALLPAGSRLTIIENHAKEILGLGNAAAQETAKAYAVRDLLFNDGKNYRSWTMQVEIAGSDKLNPLSSEEITDILDNRFSQVRFDSLLWRGVVFNRNDQATAYFPKSVTAAEAPLPVAQEIWQTIGENRIARLERAKQGNHEWQIGIITALYEPPPPPMYWELLSGDLRWGGTIAFVSAACLFAWLNLLLRWHRGKNSRQRRIVKNLTGERTLAQNSGLIMADFDNPGGLKISTLNTALPVKIPKGSLYRLQALHRGGEGISGSKILEQAKNPILRDLGSKIRAKSRISAEEFKRQILHAKSKV